MPMPMWSCWLENFSSIQINFKLQNKFQFKFTFLFLTLALKPHIEASLRFILHIKIQNFKQFSFRFPFKHCKMKNCISPFYLTTFSDFKLILFSSLKKIEIKHAVTCSIDLFHPFLCAVQQDCQIPFFNLLSLQISNILCKTYFEPIFFQSFQIIF